jgi:serine/threonine protein kinase
MPQKTTLGAPRLPVIEPGNVLAGRYRILTEVGKGGMGKVYAAEEESLGIRRNVAIKIMPPQLMLDEGLMSRFREEIKIAAQLDHPNIVPIYSLGEHQGVYFYVMKLLDGQTAYQRMKLRGPFADDELRKTIAPIARALHYAHSKGVIHRDVKSNNIHISRDGNIMLMDFGIARTRESRDITLPGQIVGTAEYMSPEQWYGEVDGRSVLYSLGVVLYELATGRYPFTSKNTYELMKMHQEMPPEPPRLFAPGLTPGLEAIILRCLEKDPHRRFANGQELAEVLERSPAAPPGEAAAAPSDPYEISTPARESSTEVRNAPHEELSDEEKDLWRQSAQADEFYSRGELDKALALIDKLDKRYPDRQQLLSRQKIYYDMQSLINQSLTHAEQMMEQTRPRQAIADYERVLQHYPMAAVADKLQQTRLIVDEAKRLYARVRFLADKGKNRPALKLLARVEKLDIEAGDIRGRRESLQSRRRTRKKRVNREPILNGPRVLVALILIAIVGLAFGLRPGLLKLADRMYAKGDTQSLYETTYSALTLYAYCQKLGLKEERIGQRIKEIAAAAKKRYQQLGEEAEGRDDLEQAEQWYKKAYSYDPDDSSLVDKISLLDAKIAVRRSLR